MAEYNSGHLRSQAPLRVSGVSLPKPPLLVKFAACKRNTKSRPHDVFSSPGLHAGQGQLEHRAIRVQVLAHEVGVLRSTATSHRLPGQSERHSGPCPLSPGLTPNQPKVRSHKRPHFPTCLGAPVTRGRNTRKSPDSAAQSR